MKRIFFVFLISLVSTNSFANDQLLREYEEFLQAKTVVIINAGVESTYYPDADHVAFLKDEETGFADLPTIIQAEIFRCREEAALKHRNDIVRTYAVDCLRSLDEVRAALSQTTVRFHISPVYWVRNSAGDLYAYVLSGQFLVTLYSSEQEADLQREAAAKGLSVERTLIPQTYRLSWQAGSEIQNALKGAEVFSRFPFSKRSQPGLFSLDGPIPHPSIGVNN